MSERALTMGDVLFPANERPKADEEPDALKEFGEAIRAELGSVDMVAVNEVLLRKLGTMLDDPFVKSLAGAWTKSAEILKYGDLEKYSPGNTYLVALGDHTVFSEYQPSIEVLVNEVPRATLKFSVKLTLELKTFQLEIRSARIRRVLTGTWTGSGDVSLEGKRVYRKVLEPVALPGVVDLGDGLAIG